ncbi:hypothetical protein EIP91_001261 [Steccherinum ochraceum]|uniref:Uncharacterized protein n=1 Tax=Steccherinum ochraceum TaxID=92696 RepID=A0A4R0REC7_9APHY|nr:hypothetical protein EIP91_001261 [Steccherinum ochraceum]
MSHESRESQAGPSTSQQQQEKEPLYWNRLPSIKILRPPQGRYSTNTDERCFTYCSQSIHGRLSQAEPWCRTVCIRKVFNHEVKRALAVYDQDPGAHLRTVDVDSKFPLPPEGQRAARFVGSLFGTPTANSSSSASSSRDAEAQWHSVIESEKPVDEVKYWKEGWYLWMSQSRWAAQEKMDLMMCDLERQAEWQKYKDKVLEEWTAFEQGQLQGGSGSVGTVGVGDSAMENHGVGPTHAGLAALQEKPVGQDNGYDASNPAGAPFPDSVSQSLLIELPPALPPVDASVRNFLAPSFRLLETTRYSLQSGHQRQFANLVWEKAQTKEPYELMQKLLRHTWNFWTHDKDPEDENKKSS